MKKITQILVFIFFTFLTLNYVEAQVYTLPIQNQSEFLDNTSRFYMKYSIGFPMKIPVSKKNNVEKYLLFRLDIGFKQKTLNFDNYFIFEDDSGILMITPDTEPTHSYPSKLFKNGYSKLKGEYISVNPEWVFLSIGEYVYFTTGPSIDIRVGSRHKRKWFEDDKKMKDKLKDNDLLKLNNFNIGWGASFYAFGIGFYYQYEFNNFFQDDWNVDLNFHSFGMIIGF